MKKVIIAEKPSLAMTIVQAIGGNFNRYDGYFENDKTFHNQVQSHMVDNPDIAFLFPAFNNRSSDDEKNR